MMELKDTTVRARHDVRLQQQRQYCTTQVMKLQQVIESQQNKLLSAAKNAERAHSKEMNVREQLRERKRTHSDELSHFTSQRDDLHRREMNQLQAKLTTQFSKEIEQMKRQLEDAHAAHEDAMNRERELHLEALRRSECLMRVKEAEFQQKLAAAETRHKVAQRQMREHAESEAKIQRQNAEVQARLHEQRMTALKNDLEKVKSKYGDKVKNIQRNCEKLKEELDGEAKRVGRRRVGLRQKYTSLLRAMEILKQRLRLRGNSLPPIEVDESSRHNNLPFFYNVQFLSGALLNRAPAAIATALARNGQIEPLSKTKEFQPIIKEAIKDAMGVLQRHWSPRMSVILMQEVHTSRSEFDALRHLLSFVYNRDEDMYFRIKVWTNPWNSKEVEYAPTLTARGPRERERAIVYQQCGAEASEDGLFVGIEDLEEQGAKYVAHYWEGIDEDVRLGKKPLVLILTGDATGGWRGDAVTHGELGIASWSAGKAKSKLTLLPLFLMEGDDSAENLRNRAVSTANSYNKLKRKGTLTVSVGENSMELNVKLLVAADFQFFKAAMNMSKYTSAVWCTCQLDNMYKRPDEEASNWEEVSAYGYVICYVCVFVGSNPADL